MVDAIRKRVLAAHKLHADDTPVPVLAPGNGKTKTGYLWTYVRDDRPAGDLSPPAVWFAYSPDCNGIHSQAHLTNFQDVLHPIRGAEHGHHPLEVIGEDVQAHLCRHAFQTLTQEVRGPIQALMVPSECSTVQCRIRMASGVCSRRACMFSSTSSSTFCPPRYG